MRDVTPADPTLRDWMAFAPLYMLREAEDRHIELHMDASVLGALERMGYCVIEKSQQSDGCPGLDTTYRVTITHNGRKELNKFLDRVGLSRADLRAAARRAARNFGRGI